MKKIFVLAALAVMAASCFKGSYYESSFATISNFEYADAANYFVDSVYVTGDFQSGSYLLYSGSRSSDGDFMGGFAMSMKKDSSINLSVSPFSIYAGSGENNTFALFYDTPEKPERQLTFTESDYGTCSPQFCYIRNTSYVVSSILSDDSRFKFSEGDYLKLVVTGYLGGNETGKAEWLLADFRIPQNGGAAPDSVNTTWQQMPLTKLGNIDAVDFSIESSKEGFPKYVCLDNLVASISVKY
ncbi:MAG: DUF4465 domain-containing protein [Candidatus Cryptobacteroides sp.]